ncbi:MAG: PQQ-dependent sugar dehydrogenase, partial [Myxococcota bacterium]
MEKHPQIRRSNVHFFLFAIVLASSAAGVRCGNSTVDQSTTAVPGLGDDSPAAGSNNSTPGDSGNSNNSNGALPGSPTLTSLVSGNGQSATVDTAVAEPIRMLVTDIDSLPVADVPVTFTVDLGGGSVQGASQLTDATGIAAPDAWVLGPTPGLNRLIGEVPGLAPIIFEATGTPDSRGSFTIFTGDRQNGRVGEALPIAPEILLLDGSGQPVTGTSVTFAINSGAGTVQGGNQTTDAQGRARVDAWVLGSTAGVQTLTASTANLPDLLFQATAVSNQDPVLETTTLEEVDNAWDLAFLPDGTLLVSSRDGNIEALNPTDDPIVMRTVLEPPDDLDVQDQSGLLGIAVDPDFTTNRYVYAFLASDRAGDIDNRIRRFVMSANGQTLTEDRDILTGISWAAGAHSGGRIEFGPDGFLWIGTGDNRSATVPQDVNEMGGKILRITREGAPAPSNVASGGRAEIYFTGVRNVQGLAFRRSDGAPFSCEHGPNNNDEVTLLLNGGNGGWD